jgi:DNA repair exonuclease SbcCD ATPase subunit
MHRTLPLPPSGRVDTVLHLSDLHIRAGESQKCRFEEYVGVICALHDAFRALPAVREGTAVAVLTGDVFHDKNNISPGGVLLFRKLVEVMRDVRVPLYVMRGNHDFRQDIASPEEPDMIRALLQGVDPEHVAYLDRTGRYVAGTVGFGLLAIQDVLQLGSTSGHVDDLPAFPDAAAFPAEVQTRVALYHGVVAGSRLPNGQPSAGSAVDEASMRAYDYAMLGDVHLQQIHGASNGAEPDLAAFPKVLGGASAHRLKLSRLRPGTWGYAGSLVQQNFGEPVLGHGFLAWQVHGGADAAIAAYHVSNAHGYLTLTKGDDGVWSALLARDAAAPIEELRQTAWVPKCVRVRIDASTAAAGRSEVADLLSAHGFVVQQGMQDLVAVAPIETQEAAHRAVFDLSTSVYTPDTWINYVADKVPALASDTQWHEVFRRPSAMLTVSLAALPAEELASGAVLKLEEKNKKLLKTLQEYDKLQDRQLGRCRAPLAILDMEWAWVLCYGEGCRFDFQKADGHVFALSGNNGSGKTAFLEILFYGLFGTTFPSRATNHAIAFVNMRKPHNHRPYIKLHFVLGGETYRLVRKLDAQMSAQKLNNKDVTLSRKVEGAVYVPEACGKPKVDQWVRERVGDPDAFLQACMLTQHNDNDFFELAPRDQMALLDKLLAMDGAALLAAAFKDSRKLHALCLEALQTPMDLLERALRERSGVDVPALEARVARQRETVQSAERLEVAFPALEALAARRPREPRASADEVRVRGDVLAQRQSAWPAEWVAQHVAAEPGPEPESEDDLSEARDALLLSKPSSAANARPLPPRKTLEEWRAFDARRRAVADSRPSDASPERLCALEERLDAIRVAKAAHGDALRTLHEDYNLYTTLKVDNKSVPFNPQCAACRQQPWKQQMLALKDRVTNADKPKVHECSARLDHALEGREEAEWLAEHDAIKRWLRDAADVEATEAFWDEERRRREECESAELRAAADAEALGAWRAALDAVEARIARRKRRAFAKEARAWAAEAAFLAEERAALDAFSAWEAEYRAAAARELSLLHAALRADEALLQREHERAAECEALRARVARLVEARDAVDARCTMLSLLAEPLEGFKAWVYETHLMPMFVRHTNAIMSTLCVERPVALQVAWREARGGERVPAWHLVDGGISPPLEKASGFQRFLTSFAARLALSRLGACGVSPCAQLFLDEGFTSCDASNLENVPVFLQGLIARGSYGSVLLVTHIEALSRCATLRVAIGHGDLGRHVRYP